MPDKARRSLLVKLHQTPSLKKQAFLAIKQSIISRELLPGNMYSEQEIADRLGISRTPVREALIELASKDFLIFIPRRGFRIRKLDRQDIDNLFEFRRGLERMVLENIVPRITELMIEDLDKICKDSRIAFQNGDQSTFISHDREFHAYLSLGTNNKYLHTSLEYIRDLVDLVSYASYMSGADEALKWHLEILEHVRARNLKEARETMDRHIVRVKEIFLDVNQSD